MALINCPKCGNQVSDKAGKCPNCGQPVAIENKSKEILIQKENAIDSDDLAESKSKKSRKGLIILICCILVIPLCIFVGLHISQITNSDKIESDRDEKQSSSELYESSANSQNNSGGTNQNYLDETNTTISKNLDFIIDTTNAKEWAAMYLDKLVNNDEDGKDGAICKFIFVNDDDIPEMWVDYGSTYMGEYIYTEVKGICDEIFVNSGSVYWTNYTNRIYITGGRMGSYYDDVYTIENGKFVHIFHGENYDTPYVYYIGIDEKRSVSFNEYEKEVQKAYDIEKIGDQRSLVYTYAECIEYLVNLLPESMVSDIFRKTEDTDIVLPTDIPVIIDTYGIIETLLSYGNYYKYDSNIGINIYSNIDDSRTFVRLYQWEYNPYYNENTFFEGIITNIMDSKIIITDIFGNSLSLEMESENSILLSVLENSSNLEEKKIIGQYESYMVEGEFLD